MTTFLLTVDRESPAPLHRQVYEGIRHAILDGRLRAGQRIPSTRALADQLGVSRLPVLNAYQQLLHEQYLEGRVGSGTYVRTSLPDELLRAPRSPVTAHHGHPALRERDYGGLRPFRVSLPALDRFPHALWARLVSRHARRLRPARMAYGDPAGVLPLRVAIAEYLRAARGVNCDAGQVIITPGSQGALRCCAEVLLARNDRVAIEEPGYPGARAAFRAAGATLMPVRVDDEGITIPRARGRVRAAYLTPSHQYPLGMAMTPARRLALLHWAVQRDAWLIEDDYDSEYRYVSRPLSALQGMSTAGRVIYVGTFSKVLFPALRIGYLVVPPSLVDDFVEARVAQDLFTPTLHQLVLAEFLRDGHFARHLRRMRGVYQSRRDALLNGLGHHCDSLVRVQNADAGLHVAVELHGMRDTDVVARLSEHRLSAIALSSCCISPHPRNGLLLGFGGNPERRLAEATTVLAEVLRQG
jgi:GntR family transcriptional regulator/MocR family aminotransferase